jgi:hypothetical protein
VSETFKTRPRPSPTVAGMPHDLRRIQSFLTTHARLLDRRRGDLAVGAGDPDLAVAALAAHRNPDGGYGWALEPDLRAPASQPVAALHAFEVFEEIAPRTSPLAAELCDWLDAVSLPAGALPFALPGADSPGTAPFWAAADPAEPSLHITSAVAGIAHRVGRHDPAVAAHPWLARATSWCLDEIPRVTADDHALLLLYVLVLLDALHDDEPRAREELARVGAFLPADGRLQVAGGADDEALRPLDFAPEPGGPLRALFDATAIERDLDRLEAEQDEDGGWRVSWIDRSPAAALEWRGYATVRAVRILVANGRLAP